MSALDHGKWEKHPLKNEVTELLARPNEYGYFIMKDSNMATVTERYRIEMPHRLLHYFPDILAEGRLLGPCEEVFVNILMQIMRSL